MIEKIKVYEETPSGYKHPENIIQDKINELVDAVNALVYERDKDSDWYDGQTRAVNVQDHIANASKMVDIGELAYLQKENSDLKDEIDILQDELDRTRKALDVAIKRLGYIKNNYKNWTPDRDEQMIAQAANGLDEIKTALEQKENNNDKTRNR